MERALGADFSSVRVHADEPARQVSASLGARAFAAGDHLVFGSAGAQDDMGLLAHELTHVLQQRSSAAVTSSTATEAEAAAAAAAVGAGHRFRVARSAVRGAPQLERVRVRGREFEVGAVRLHGNAATDVRRHGVLFPGPDQAHVLVTEDGRLGYEVAHTSPDDPYRWFRLREIVDTGALDIHAVATDGQIRVKEVTPQGTQIVQRSLFALGGNGVTLPRLERARALGPGVERFAVSPDDSRDRIYYLSDARGRSLTGGNALAHELFGHYYLALKGVPFVHPPTVEETERRRGAPLLPEEAARMRVAIARRGTLREEHGVRDPFGRVFVGTVREYIDRYAGATTMAVQSPTQHVSEAFLQELLTGFAPAARAPGALVRTDAGGFEASDAFALHWELLSTNYWLLRLNPAPTPAGLTAEAVVDRVVAVVRALDLPRREAFRLFLVQLGWMPGRRQELTTDVLQRLRVP
jgi:hypothetical protein